VKLLQSQQLINLRAFSPTLYRRSCLTRISEDSATMMSRSVEKGLDPEHMPFVKFQRDFWWNFINKLWLRSKSFIPFDCIVIKGNLFSFILSSEILELSPKSSG
jgi:hypothetical protein